MGNRMIGMGIATVFAWLVLCTAAMPQRVDALQGCCVCNGCDGGGEVCDEQQNGQEQCQDFCAQQNCDFEDFHGGVMSTCAGGCEGDFGGGGQTPVSTATPTEGVPRELICNDGIDNDMDNDTDCEDEDCQGMSECSNPAPAISPPQLLVLAILLAMGGLLVLARRTRNPGQTV